MSHLQALTHPAALVHPGTRRRAPGARLDRTWRSRLREVGARRRLEWLVPAVAAVVLLPWAAYLGASLPGSYVSQDWSTVWVGFDVALSAALAAAAVLTRRRHPAAVVASTVAGTLLLCDAWFDVLTSGAGDTVTSVLSLLAEVPLALLLLGGAVRSLGGGARRG